MKIRYGESADAVYIKKKPDIIYGHLHEGAFVGGS